jgi:hypothetical protein
VSSDVNALFEDDNILTIPTGVTVGEYQISVTAKATKSGYHSKEVKKSFSFKVDEFIQSYPAIDGVG